MVMRLVDDFESFNVEYFPLLNIDIRQDSMIIFTFKRYIFHNITPFKKKINYSVLRNLIFYGVFRKIISCKQEKRGADSRDRVNNKIIFPGVKLHPQQNTPLFLKSGGGSGGRRKTFFPVKKSFSPPPDSHPHLSEKGVIF